MEIVIAAGIPSAIVGFVVWLLKRSIDTREEKRVEREAKQEKLFLMMMQSTRSNAVGITAIARAVQRIPDAHCNGDMTAALEVMAKHQAEEKEFLMQQGVEHIFDA